MTRSMWCSTSTTAISPPRRRISCPRSFMSASPRPPAPPPPPPGRGAPLPGSLRAAPAGPPRRLVEQQQLRPRDQRAGERDPLGDRERQLARQPLGVLGDAQLAQRVVRSVAQRALV